MLNQELDSTCSDDMMSDPHSANRCVFCDLPTSVCENQEDARPLQIYKLGFLFGVHASKGTYLLTQRINSAYDTQPRRARSKCTEIQGVDRHRLWRRARFLLKFSSQKDEELAFEICGYHNHPFHHNMTHLLLRGLP